MGFEGSVLRSIKVSLGCVSTAEAQVACKERWRRHGSASTSTSTSTSNGTSGASNVGGSQSPLASAGGSG